MLRIIYMGTPAFAVPALEALIRGAVPGEVFAEGYKIVTVITRPDKPVGRNQEIAYSPIKQAALAQGLPVWQPGSFKKAENQAALANYQADLFIVAAFGQILPQAVLDLPRYGTLNIHASLLPKYRGSSPISEAILQGETESGITIMLLDAGIDTGPMLLQRAIALTEDETTSSLTQKLAQLGASALLEVVPRWVGGQTVVQPQDSELASYTHMLKKTEGRLDWSRPAEVLARAVRAYTPWPNAYTTWRGKLLKILSATSVPSTLPVADQPGQVALSVVAPSVGSSQKVLSIATGNGDLLVDRVQLAGKKAMNAEEFIRGYAQILGERLT
jgi:methionyl-tRNA formyltransferase